MHVVITTNEEINAILTQENIEYDCVAKNERYVEYQVRYFDIFKNFVGIVTYRFICPVEK